MPLVRCGRGDRDTLKYYFAQIAVANLGLRM